MKNGKDQTGIGENTLPENIRKSKIPATGNIELLASVAAIPVIDPSFYDERLKNIFQHYSVNPAEMEKELHLYAKELPDNGNV
ncbi:MAG TPA: hypothetical protein VK645_01400 [Chitinophagaceae bacterium]|nr:hypothetical protein [Chitinophagaceae bacterium]